MEIPVAHTRFQKQQLTVRPAGWFSASQVLLNGARLKRVKGVYLARADDGSDVSIRLGAAFGDPVPTLRVGDEVVQLAKPLKWFEYAWAALPMLLLFVGGALGGLAGALGSYCNFRIFRSDRGGITKYALSGATSAIAVVLFFVFAVTLRQLIGR